MENSVGTFSTDRLLQGDRPSQVTVNTGSTVLRDWKEAMYSCIDERIKILQPLHINKRKKQVLKSKVHLDYLNKLHDNFVLYITC